MSEATPDADDSACFVCGSRPADAAHPIVVSLRKTLGQSGSTLAYQTAQVRVPACAECRRRESGRERRGNGLVLAFMLVPAVAGGVALGWEGALLGFGLGFFASFVVGAFATGRSVARRHPAVRALEDEGWHYQHMFGA
jgi:hypothetical protein